MRQISLQNTVDFVIGYSGWAFCTVVVWASVGWQVYHHGGGTSLMIVAGVFLVAFMACISAAHDLLTSYRYTLEDNEIKIKALEKMSQQKKFPHRVSDSKRKIDFVYAEDYLVAKLTK